MTHDKSVFDFDSYKKFVHFWLKTMPKNGHGQLSRIAKHLSISSVSVSHVFNGPRDLSEEQALELSEFFGFSELEADYFLLLVQHSRAGSFKLKEKLKVKQTDLRQKSQDLKSRLPQEAELNEASKAQFYSNWFYIGTSLACTLSGPNSLESLSQYLGLPRTKMREVLEFLLQHGLLVQTNKGYQAGTQSTHLGANSILISRHHTNWRLKGLENMNDLAREELFYTGPMTLSLATMSEIRKDLVDFIDSVVKKVGPSPSEQLACLNIDWFKIKPKT